MHSKSIIKRFEIAYCTTRGQTFQKKIMIVQYFYKLEICRKRMKVPKIAQEDVGNSEFDFCRSHIDIT